MPRNEITAAFYFTPGGIISAGDGPVRYATELIREALWPYPGSRPFHDPQVHHVEVVSAEPAQVPSTWARSCFSVVAW